MLYVLLVGFTDGDNEAIIDKMIEKIIHLRIFEDENEKMNLGLKDINGELLIISQFTLYAVTRDGNRPSFIEAAKPDIAIPLYEKFIEECKKEIDVVETGVFGADMKIDLLNDGPVTIIIDSKNR